MRYFLGMCVIGSLSACVIPNGPLSCEQDPWCTAEVAEVAPVRPEAVEAPCGAMGEVCCDGCDEDACGPDLRCEEVVPGGIRVCYPFCGHIGEVCCDDGIADPFCTDGKSICISAVCTEVPLPGGSCSGLGERCCSPPDRCDPGLVCDEVNGFPVCISGGA